MKSAYEAALERMAGQGIEKPREDALSDEAKEKMAEVRQRAEAALAQLEILHRDRLSKTADPLAAGEEDDEYRRERARIDERRDRDIRKIREDS